MAGVWLWTAHKDKPIPRKLAMVLAALFLLASFFKAWQDQHEQAKNYLSQLKSRPSPPVQVNIPAISVPPAQVIIESVVANSKHQTPRHDSYMIMRSVVPVTGKNEIEGGKSVALNTNFQHVGPERIYDFRSFPSLGFVDVRGFSADEVKAEFSQMVSSVEHGAEGGTFGKDETGFKTAESKVLTSDEADQIVLGKKMLILQVWATWKTDSGDKGSINECWIVQNPTRILSGLNFVLRSCN